MPLLVRIINANEVIKFGVSDGRCWYIQNPELMVIIIVRFKMDEKEIEGQRK
jgi:hypothetical protein